MMSESKEADTNGFSEEFHIMSWWMVKALNHKLCKMLILFIGGDAPYLPCLVKLTKLWNCLNQNLLKRHNKKIQLWSVNYRVSTRWNRYLQFGRGWPLVYEIDKENYIAKLSIFNKRQTYRKCCQFLQCINCTALSSEA